MNILIRTPFDWTHITLFYCVDATRYAPFINNNCVKILQEIKITITNKNANV